MSAYGRLWEKVQDIRNQLHILMPGTSPSKEWNTLANARAAVERRKAALDELIQQWEGLERDMERTEG